MNKLLGILTVATSLLAFVSCSDENEPIGTILSGFMTGYTNSKGQFESVKDDTGNTYAVSQDLERGYLLPADTMLRMVAVAYILEDGTLDMQQTVATHSYQAPLDHQIPDSMRVNDPLSIMTSYIGGGYLNLEIGIKVQKEGTSHALIYTVLPESGMYHFKLYHNAHGDKPVYTKKAYFSIPLSHYGLSHGDSVRLSCAGYESDYDIKLIYR